MCCSTPKPCVSTVHRSCPGPAPAPAIQPTLFFTSAFSPVLDHHPIIAHRVSTSLQSSSSSQSNSFCLSTIHLSFCSYPLALRDTPTQVIQIDLPTFTWGQKQINCDLVSNPRACPIAHSLQVTEVRHHFFTIGHTSTTSLLACSLLSLEWPPSCNDPRPW